MSVGLVVYGNYKDILGAMLAKEVVPSRIEFEMSFLCGFLRALDPNAELKKATFLSKRGLPSCS
jgi:hypothetical protein